MSIAANGYTGARSGTGLLITTAIHIALGAALLSLGVVQIAPTITPPIKIIKTPPERTPVENVEPVLPDEHIEPFVDAPEIEIAIDFPPPPDTGLRGPDAATPLPPSGGGVIAVLPKPVDPVITGARLDPRFAARFQPPYPPASERQDEQGVVTVRVRVGTDGRVLAAELEASSGHRRLDEAAVQHARRAWRFVPAMRDGVPVETWREVPVRFEIKNG